MRLTLGGTGQPTDLPALYRQTAVRPNQFAKLGYCSRVVRGVNGRAVGHLGVRSKAGRLSPVRSTSFVRCRLVCVGACDGKKRVDIYILIYLVRPSYGNHV